MCEVEKIEQKLLKKLNNVEAEKESLCVFDVNAVLDSLKVDNSLHLSKFQGSVWVWLSYGLLHSSTTTIDHILSSKKSYGHKCRLGLNPSTSSSKITPVTKKKIIFFPTCMDDIVLEVADKGKGVLVDNRYEVKGFNPRRI